MQLNLPIKVITNLDDIRLIEDARDLFGLDTGGPREQGRAPTAS
jgi:hypothetical protein